MNKRTEYDGLGNLEIPQDVYWGIHTARAVTNFPLSGYRIYPRLIKALAMVKKAAVLANQELNYLDSSKAKVIEQACDEIIAGNFLDQFPVDAFQGGAGTSTNMNMNEVLANRAIEILGGHKGEYSRIHPLDDVNKFQSTNDVYPTAVKVAVIFGLRDLSQEIAKVQGVFQQKEKEFAAIVKIGRTELQAAVPMTLGKEFSAFAESFSRDRWRTFKCEERLRVVNLGGTAVGTGLGAPQSFIFLVIEKLRSGTGLGLSRAENVVDQTANTDVFVEVSGILKAHATSLIKISNDLRLLNLLGELRVPKKQAGSSIMPGKVNPVILEAAMQVGMKVKANDALIASCVSHSTLQINEFMPLVAFCLIESVELLININRILVDYIMGIEAHSEKCKEYLDQAETLITAFVPAIGYEKAEKLLQGFSQGGSKNFREFLETELGPDLVKQTLSPEKLNALGFKTNG